MNDRFNRFKFRTWNKKTKKMKKVMALISEEGVYYSLIIRDDKAVVTPCEEPHMVLMPCTGLKDKNGVLIYEGDILKTTGNREATGCGVVEYLQSGCRYYVNGYLDNPSPYHPRKKGELYQPLQAWLCTEVIGNIYENPELLEVENG